MNFRNLLERTKLFFQTPSGQSLLKWTQRIFLLLVLFWLFWQVSRIGWSSVWHSLPTQSAFYLLFLLVYFQLPFFEVMVYRSVWTFPLKRAIPIFLLKRIYNSDLLGYSGEVYLYVWARRQLKMADRKIFMTIKDVNILSSLASTIVAFGLLALFLFTDQIKLIDQLLGENDLYFWGGVALTILLALLLIRFRRYVIGIPQKKAFRIFGIHFFRLILLQFLNVLIYYVVIPDAPFHVWFTLLSMEIILSRIPFLPNRDLVFAGLSIGVAQGLAVTQSEIAGIVLARAAMGKLLSLISFGLANLLRKRIDFLDSLEEESLEKGLGAMAGSGSVSGAADQSVEK